MKNKKNKKDSTRRKFLKMGLTVGAGSIAGAGMFSSCSKSELENEEMIKVLSTDGKIVEVPQSSIHINCKPLVPHKEARVGMIGRKFVMVIDLSKCRNARKCIDVCQEMHKLPSDIEWIKVYLMRDSEDTAPYWFPKPCFHCNTPACVNVCPVGATFKRQDGIVLIDNKRCIGCKFCMAACPYSSRSFNWREVEDKESPDAPYSPETGIPARVGTVGKCDYCPDTIRRGELPHCVEACPNGVIYFGDKNEDTVSNGEDTVRFSDLIRDKAGYRFFEELGTRPNCYYLPPVNRLFPVEKGFEDLTDEVKARYKTERAYIQKYKIDTDESSE